MKILCKKQDLLDNIQKIEGAVSVKTTMPVLSNVLFESEGGKIQLTATDLEITIKCQIPDVDVKKEGSITLPARKLIDIVKELPQADVSIEADEKNLVTIKCGKTVYKIMGLPKADFPAILEPKSESVNIKIKQGILRNVIKKSAFAVSSDETRKILTGVYLLTEGTELKMVGTDGHRLAFIKTQIAKTDKPAKVIVPTKILNELLKFMNDDNEISITIYENQINFKMENLLITSRLIEGQYPSYEQIINKIFDKKIKVSTEAFLKAVKRVSILAIDKTSTVKVKAVENAIHLAASAVDVGEAEEEIAAEYKGEDIVAAFNAKYIIDVLKAVDTESVEMQLRDSSSAGLIKPVGDENYLYIIMPVRI